MWTRGVGLFRCTACAHGPPLVSNMKEENKMDHYSCSGERQFLLRKTNSFDWCNTHEHTEHPRILTAPVCVPFDWWALFQMFFHPNQWEFKCLLHVNTKQNISRSGPTANSLSADFITHLSVAPHDSRTQRGRRGGKNGRQTPLEAGNFTHTLLLRDLHKFYGKCHFVCFWSVTLDVSLTFCVAFLTPFSDHL